MSEKWTIERVSTLERILDKINNRMAQPVGIMLFGADCDFKNDVVAELRAGLHDAKVFHGAPSTHEMVELLHSGKVSLFVLSSMESIDSELRHECTQVMRNIGAKTVVGIHTKTRAKFFKLCHMSPLEVEANRLRNKVVKALSDNPPTAEDGIDYLFTAKEEE